MIKLDKSRDYVTFGILVQHWMDKNPTLPSYLHWKKIVMVKLTFLVKKIVGKKIPCVVKK